MVENVLYYSVVILNKKIKYIGLLLNLVKMIGL